MKAIETKKSNILHVIGLKMFWNSATKSGQIRSADSFLRIQCLFKTHTKLKFCLFGHVGASLHVFFEVFNITNEMPNNY